MTLHTRIISETVAKEIAALKALAATANALAEAKALCKRDTLSEELALCKAAINVADDGDFLTLQSNLCEQFGVDPDGYCTDEYGDRLGEGAYRTALADGSVSEWRVRP